MARTLADLDGEAGVARIHIAEALSYRGETRKPQPKIFLGTSISWDKPGKRLQYPQTVTQYSNWFANRDLLWPNRGCRAVSCFSRW